MKAKYIKEHNNYDLTLGETYEATFYKLGWLLVDSDDKGSSVLYREECFERDEYSTEEAAELAIKWCEKHPGWKRICDIEDSDKLYKTWDELSEKDKKCWIKEYGNSAEDAWREFGKKPCKVKYGFITGKGEFYRNILEVPLYHNVMQVYKIG